MAFQLKNIATTKKETTSFAIDNILKKEISFGTLTGGNVGAMLSSSI